jgi:hypothetical protein
VIEADACSTNGDLTPHNKQTSIRPNTFMLETSTEEKILATQYFHDKGSLEERFMTKTDRTFKNEK